VNEMLIDRFRSINQSRLIITSLKLSPKQKVKKNRGLNKAINYESLEDYIRLSNKHKMVILSYHNRKRRK